MTEDEIVGWHHQLHGHEFEQTLGDSEGQRRLACCSPWGCKGSDMTWLNNNNRIKYLMLTFIVFSDEIGGKNQISCLLMSILLFVVV